MKLNHLNLTVTDVTATTAFFVRYFGFTCIEMKGANMLSVLHGTDGFILTLMSEAFNKDGMQSYPASFHFGFILSTAKEVTDLYQRFKADELLLEKEPAVIRHSFGFYFHFDRLMIEIDHYFK